MPLTFLAIASSVGILVVVLLCLAYPIQTLVIKIRNVAFLKMNRGTAVLIPNATFDDQAFTKIYKNPCAHQRSRGAGLADVFWYFLSPGAHMHQETMEEGALYDTIAPLTRQLLSKSADSFRALINKHTQNYIDHDATRNYALVRLRDLLIPIWANFFYELIFDEAPTPEELKLIVTNATEFIQTTKCVKLRDMKPRYAAVELAKKKIKEGKFTKTFPSEVSLEDQAFYLRGIYLTSAITQLSEAVSHVLLCLADHPEYQEKILTDDHDFLDKIVMETLRLYPLFGISLRILSDDITLDEHHSLKKNTAVCFHHPSFHRMGYPDADEFKPERWDDHTHRDVNFIPFGVVGNHSCPAQGLATIAIPACVKLMVKHFTFKSTAKHTRSQVLRAPCLIIRRGQSCLHEKRLLAFLSIRNRVETLTTSIKQLFIEAITFLHAKRLKLAQRYYTDHR